MREMKSIYQEKISDYLYREMKEAIEKGKESKTKEMQEYWRGVFMAFRVLAQDFNIKLPGDL
jgi:stalled ribosome alternative rescue factor ArfA